MDATLEDRYWQIRFEARLRGLYNGRMARRCAFFGLSVNFLEFVLSTSAVGALFARHATLGIVLASVVAALSFISLVLRVERRGFEHEERSKEYGLLEDAADETAERRTEAGWHSLKERFGRLMSEETATLDCMEVVCHCDTMESFGMRPIMRLGWIERTVGRFLPIPYTPKAGGAVMAEGKE